MGSLINNWLEIVGIGIIFPTIVALVSYFLKWEDEKIESLYFQIINRLLSYCGKSNEQAFQSIRSLSLKDALYEIDYIRSENFNINKAKIRVDIEYNCNSQGQVILKRLKKQVSIQKRERCLVWVGLILFIIWFFSAKSGIIKIF